MVAADRSIGLDWMLQHVEKYTNPEVGKDVTNNHFAVDVIAHALMFEISVSL